MVALRLFGEVEAAVAPRILLRCVRFLVDGAPRYVDLVSDRHFECASTRPLVVGASRARAARLLAVPRCSEPCVICGAGGRAVLGCRGS